MKEDKDKGMTERLRKQQDFILEIDKMKNIFRQSRLTEHGRRENDAEHSWHMAVMAFLLQEYANEKVDMLRVLMMILIHDLVEIDAGDTFAYDEEANKTKRVREEAAADRLFGMLPRDQEKLFRDLWEEFEESTTPEAMYAHVMDNFQPMLLHDSNNGEGWRGNDIKKEQIYKRNEKTGAGSKEIWELMSQIIDKNVKVGNIIDN